MLVLSRREDDKILFPHLGISVHILKVAGNKVRLGVKAPSDVKVLRNELSVTEQAVDGNLETYPSDLLNTLNAARDSAVSVDDLEGSLAARRSVTESLNSLLNLGGKDLDKDWHGRIYDLLNHLKTIDERKSKPAEKPKTTSNSRSALLVEDNPNEQKLLASFLRLRNFDVAVANDGNEALNYLAANKEPDFMLLDMKMQGMDGPTTIRTLRNDHIHNELKVFAVSGSDPQDYGVSIGPDGVDAWFPKPLDPEALVFRLSVDESRNVTEKTA